MLDVKALRHAMIDADCTMRELAAVCKISRSTLNKRLSGKVSFKLGEIMACSERLRLSPEQRNKIFFADKVS
jgi:transcriptional regulator with XRE-family HTH domain